MADSKASRRKTARFCSAASRSHRRAPRSRSRRRSAPRMKSSTVRTCGAAATRPGTRSAMTAPARSAMRSGEGVFSPRRSTRPDWRAGANPVPVAGDRVRQCGPRLRGDRRPALGHRRRREWAGPRGTWTPPIRPASWNDIPPVIRRPHLPARNAAASPSAISSPPSGASMLSVISPPDSPIDRPRKGQHSPPQRDASSAARVPGSPRKRSLCLPPPPSAPRKLARPSRRAPRAEGRLR